MPLPLDLIGLLSAPHPKKIFERLLKEKERKPNKAVWSLTNEILPVDLYCYLSVKFGRPNGPQNFFRNDDSDNLIHWDWMLDHPTGHINFLGTNFRTEIWVSGDFSLEKEDCHELVKLIKDDFKNHGREMSEARKSLEKWAEFVNPYQRLSRSVEQMLSEIRKLDLQPETQSLPDFADDEEAFKESWGEALGRYSKGLGLCFGVRSMLPVMAEAYVNFLLFVLMRAELKTDNRLRENTLRQPIDIRVKSLHMTCVGFEKPIDYTTSQCKAYHSLVNERNDLLHGNVVLEKLKFNDVYFNGKVPIFSEYRSMWKRTVGVEIDAVGLHRLEKEVEVVQSFIEYITSCLQPEVQKTIKYVAQKRELGWNSKTGGISVLFPDHLADFKVGFGGAIKQDSYST
ncbi:hypothetical protein [Pseudoduganella albidiflava]|uniref:Apea-like HEPN domain-containing protein n=1 Tax=Pseudoduganella albidiflava TaxID=321983 RepID=A0A411X2G9_9BURK|nr:hypothetical protein [Pseudoduganella albidiflava]QBI03108.1 hypothetical protein EYF70_21430 [Pseudoduganella albidiflava]GGY69852.1 hypothetical protein GCM10007387_59760 [Pseudoduganella albidiflava]